MKCPSCNRRKGKRPCPALRKDICAQCCGEKRVLEIQCPSDCSFLEAGVEHEARRVYSALFESLEDRVLGARLLANMEALLPLIKEIEFFLGGYYFSMRSANDRDVQEALEVVLENYRTESRGIIYQHPSSNPFLQSIVRKLTAEIESVREATRKEMHSLPVSAIVSALEFQSELIRFLVETSSDHRAYLKFAVRQFPGAYGEEREKGSGDPGIILAGR